jgi:acetylornithine deacetylase/succinyl-diaminopimelate desuccinylase-like protein
VDKAGNVLRALTSVKLSCRIPPGVSSAKAMDAMKVLLESDPPYGAQVSFTPDEPCDGWKAPPLADWLEQSINHATNLFFHNPCVQTGEGGSIPFMAMLGEQFPEAQFVITGVLGPESNAHGPNEFLHLEMAEKVTCCIAHLLHDFVRAKVQDD